CNACFHKRSFEQRRRLDPADLCFIQGAAMSEGNNELHSMLNSGDNSDSARQKRRIPRSFKELTPSNHFSPRSFFYEMVWKALLTPRIGQHRRPVYPKLPAGKVALT